MNNSIFISYSSEDREFARKLARDLKDRSVEVWLDAWEIKVGDLLASRIGDAIKDSSYFGIVLTPSSIKKPWVQTELNAALIKELNSKRVTVLPILREDCEIPALLWGKRYADFRSDYDKGLSALLRVFEPTIRLPALPFDRVVQLKDNLKHVPTVTLLVNGTVLVGVIGGISKSRNTLGIDPLYSSPTEHHFPPMHPNETTFWVEVDSALVADMWPLEAPISQEFDRCEREPERREAAHAAWQNEPGWVPWHFYDETCHRLRAIANKEHFTALVPVRDLAAMGPRLFRYGSISATGYMPLYCDWWYLDAERRREQECALGVTYKARMDSFFKSPDSAALAQVVGTPEDLASVEEETFDLENDDWAVMLIRPCCSNSTGSELTQSIPVAFRWRSMFFSPTAISRMKTPFRVLGEVVQSTTEFDATRWPHYVKARGAFFPHEEGNHERH